MIDSRCGILCRECSYREQTGCTGCVEIKKPFWSDDGCPLKECCEKQSLEHCGDCKEFPCKMLHQFAYDKEQGDNGKRIVQCNTWKKEELI